MSEVPVTTPVAPPATSGSEAAPDNGSMQWAGADE